MAKQRTDEWWEEVKAAWIAGAESQAQMERRFGVTRKAINNRAKTHEWPDRVGQDEAMMLVDKMAETKAVMAKVTGGHMGVTPPVFAEYDRLADLQLLMEDNARAIAEKLPQMLANIETMQELQQASVAHKNLHDTHFKVTPDNQTNIQVNNSLSTVDALKGLDARV